MILRPLILVLAAVAIFADAPADNIPDKVRPVPPPGIKISEEDRAELTKSLEDLRETLEAVPTNRSPAHVADAWVYHKAVDYALRYDEFLGTNDVQTAEMLLRVGHGKANELHKQQGQRQEGGGIFGPGNLVVHGYVSKIDGSIQPYGLVVPNSYNLSLAHDRSYRLDAWFHGRDEK